MKILLAVNNLTSFFVHRRSLFLSLSSEHSVEVIFPSREDHSDAVLAAKDATVHFVPLDRKGINPFLEFKTVYSYWQIYRQKKPDLVHHFTIKPVIYGSIAARIAGVDKIVNTITGLGYVFTSETFAARLLKVLVVQLYRICFFSRRVKVIFQNEDDFKYFVDKKIIRCDQGILIEGSGVDTEKFFPVGTSNKVPRLLMAARLLKDKGIYEIMEAFALLKARGLEFEGIIAGDLDSGNPASISKNQFKKWCIENNATFLGFQKDIPALLNTVDIAVLPSYREGLPMSLLEAMAAGKPIVTTDAPGCRSTVSEGENGFLVPVKDVQGLVDALEKLIVDVQLRNKMGQASRRLALEHFSTTKINSEISKVYTSYATP